MLTKIDIRNFKRFESVSVDLGNPVVLIGPNNSGKTTALQALALWNLGLKTWNEKRGDSVAPGKRPGVAINRRDLIAAPIPDSNLLWRDLHVRNVRKENGKQTTSNIRIDIKVTGVSANSNWACGLEFDYTNEESFYCRPLRLSEDKNAERMPVPMEAGDIKVAFLPPLSGLADREFERQPGEIGYLIGQGRTAEVLRNLCYQVRKLPNGEGEIKWDQLCKSLEGLFGITLSEPTLVKERSEIVMAYKDRSGAKLDLSCSGRGVQQTLLLLAYMAVNPGAVLLLDEPDAHLEILRQRQIYRVLSESAAEQNSQIVAASHSEVILNEAAGRDVVVAFVGAPHRIDAGVAQVLKSLREIGFEQYYQAEEQGWVLYLEGSSDLSVLQSFAEKLNHETRRVLELPFVHYVGNQPQKARDHFFGLREAKSDLVGFLLCDRLEVPLRSTEGLIERMWGRREIENYLCQPDTLFAYAEDLARELAPGPLFQTDEIKRLHSAMDTSIRELVPPLALQELADRWWLDVKASDEFLDRLFERFFQRVGVQNPIRKSGYHRLAKYVQPTDVDPEVKSVLDAILVQSKRAKPRG